MDKRDIAIPGTDKVVPARFLDGAEPKWQPNVSPRVTLAEWITARDNSYFSRAAVNRMWFYFFGTGLIDPVDEMVGTEAVPSHPELLDELARGFAANQFDLKYLIRVITASRAYQLTSANTDKDREEPSLFARMAIKGLTPEQLFDSVAQATGFQDGSAADLIGLRVANSPRAEFLAKFANQSDKITEAQTSILQALTLMNGRIVSEATSLDRSRTLMAVLDSPFMSTAERIETLYLATLSRKPRAKELARLVEFVDNGGAKEGDAKPSPEDYNRALADVLWALLNSVEFSLNH